MLLLGSGCCITRRWEQTLQGPQAHPLSYGRDPDLPSSITVIRIKHSPQSTEWVEFVTWVQLYPSGWQVSRIHCWTGTSCTPSIVATVRRLPEESFLIASKSLSCSLNGPSGDTGKIKQLFENINTLLIS